MLRKRAFCGPWTFALRKRGWSARRNAAVARRVRRTRWVSATGAAGCHAPARGQRTGAARQRTQKEQRARCRHFSPFNETKNCGAAGRIRTHDPLVRSQVLYPTELQPREGAKYISAPSRQLRRRSVDRRRAACSLRSARASSASSRARRATHAPCAAPPDGCSPRSAAADLERPLWPCPTGRARREHLAQPQPAPRPRWGRPCCAASVACSQSVPMPLAAAASAEPTCARASALDLFKSFHGGRSHGPAVGRVCPSPRRAAPPAHTTRGIAAVGLVRAPPRRGAAGRSRARHRAVAAPAIAADPARHRTRNAWCLASRPRGVERLGVLTSTSARRAASSASACVRRASAGRQLGQATRRARGASPSSSAHSAPSSRAPSSTACCRRGRAATRLQRHAQQLVAPRASHLHPVQAARGQQVRQHAQLAVAGQLRRCRQIASALRCAALWRTVEAARKVLGHRLAQRSLRRALALRARARSLARVGSVISESSACDHQHQRKRADQRRRSGTGSSDEVDAMVAVEERHQRVVRRPGSARRRWPPQRTACTRARLAATPGTSRAQGPQAA